MSMLRLPEVLPHLAVKIAISGYGNGDTVITDGGDGNGEDYFSILFFLKMKSHKWDDATQMFPSFVYDLLSVIVTVEYFE